jgi:hypothetical protein
MRKEDIKETMRSGAKRHSMIMKGDKARSKALRMRKLAKEESKEVY